VWVAHAFGLLKAGSNCLGHWPDYVGRHMLQNARWMWLVVLERMEGQRNLRVLSHIERRRKIRHSPGSKNFLKTGKVS
jgi:hypothetical protein